MNMLENKKERANISNRPIWPCHVIVPVMRTVAENPLAYTNRRLSVAIHHAASKSATSH